MSTIFWLRCESKKNEFRRALTPNDCQKLIEAGHQVIVEDWDESIIPTDEYRKIGCEITEVNSWVDAPKEVIVVGLKALLDQEQYIHTHVYFAHAYKEQDGWKELLGKFQKGGGRIIDLEFMLDNNHRRVCAFGYWAGYVGAALGALFSHCSNTELACKKLKDQKRFSSKQELVKFVQDQIQERSGSAIIIGASGRSGSGAQDFLQSIHWSTQGWDREQTKKGGPFVEILDYDLFVNCVLAMSKQPPFINKDMISHHSEIALKSISDVSCDPDSQCNMVPLYTKATTLNKPYIDINGVKLTAIDNLPSILPKESSYDFSSQLSPHLLELNCESGPIATSLNFYQEAIAKLA